MQPALDSHVAHLAEKLTRDDRDGGELCRYITKALLARYEGNFLWPNLACRVVQVSFERRDAVADWIAYMPTGVTELYKYVVTNMLETLLIAGNVYCKTEFMQEKAKWEAKDIHSYNTRKCLAWLSGSLGTRAVAVADLSPADHYATSHWLYHLTQVDFTRRAVLSEVNEFLIKYFLQWLEVMMPSDKTPRDDGEGAAELLHVNEITSSQWLPEPPKVRQHSSSIILEGNIDTGDVRSCVYSPDGSRIASASNDGTLRIWDVYTGEMQHIIMTGQRWVYKVQFSNDGGRHLAALDESCIKIWNANMAVLEKTLQVSDFADGGDSDPPRYYWSFSRDMAFSEDGTRLAGITGMNTVGVWKILSYEPVKAWCAPRQDAQTSATCSRIWDMRIPDNLQVSAGLCEDITVGLWNAGDAVDDAAGTEERTATPVERRTIKEHTNPISMVSFSPDGQLWHQCRKMGKYVFGMVVASALKDGLVHVWDLTEEDYSDHDDDGNNDEVNDNGNGGTAESKAGVDEETTKLPIRVFEAGWVRSVAFSAKDGYLVSGGSKGIIILWKMECEANAHGNSSVDNSYKTFKANGSVSGHAFMPGPGKRIISSSASNIQIWDIRTGACSRVVKTEVSFVSLQFHPGDHEPSWILTENRCHLSRRAGIP
ncbi:WD40-repeat-containing domain protein [Apodospora peruviana]|uniref:WD40-repeat-containing domain protein n=1 Tax=Apodospora peruviana TaxID=516989 RepID=A0AAE0IH34_9PEZI|nr:WD40-repeat-containing domain protein [Apodospora peruviana]